MGSTSVLVDLVLDDSECNEVACHRYNRDDESDRRDKGCHQRAEDTSSECEQEGDECKAACDWVKDHDTRERLRGINRRGVIGD